MIRIRRTAAAVAIATAVAVAAPALIASAAPAHEPASIELDTVGHLTWGFTAEPPAALRAELVEAMEVAINATNTIARYDGTVGSGSGWANKVRVNYNSGVPTAQASLQWEITFGGSRNGRVAQHELSHWLTWNPTLFGNLSSGGKWQGPITTQRYAARSGAGTSLSVSTGNGHWWDYGLNYDTEWSRTNSARNVVIASSVRADMGYSDGVARVDGEYRLATKQYPELLVTASGTAPLAESTTDPAQLWNLDADDNAYWSFANAGGTLAATSSGSVSLTGNLTAWEPIPATDGYFVLKNPALNNRCLAVPTTSSGALRTVTCNTNDNYQLFHIAKKAVAIAVQSLPSPSLATTVGAAPALPAKLTAALADGSSREVPVTWDLTGVDFSTPWSTVTVTGSYGSATTTARVEVVPAGTEFFADINGTASGTLGFDSPAYLSVKALLGDQLLNGAPDQALTGDRTWGHWGKDAAGVSTVNYKGVVAGAYDKLTTTGLYTANPSGASVGYTLTLPAGRHTIAAGSHSWWAGNSRTANVALAYGGQTHPMGTITLNTATPATVLSYDIVLAQPGPVTLSLTGTNGQSPLLSWVAAVALEAAPAAPASPVSLTATTRCVAGKATVVVTAVNDGEHSAAVSLSTPYGSKSDLTVASGKSASVTFTTRQAQIDATAVTGTAEAGGQAFALSAAAGATNCG
ncbi:MAG TPA: Ig-like domain-containing protein [Arachnia sp.]|nr:Ig-like domain-containing protein [Arachnia sp.]HMT86507.1 Ig-like domain-containing protein [Arachnia sp.]